ncbi:MAG: TonB-dependent receptor domain-containing protein, partial [Flavobacteriales bacterium]
FLSRSDFLTDTSFENVQAKQNVGNKRFNISGKLDFRPANNTFLSIGGTYYNSNYRNYSYWRSMFSSENNSNSTQETFRVFGKLTQKFGDEESNSKKSANLIKNAFITIQADYTSNLYKTFDKNHEFDLFNYGHVGTFTTHKRPVYQNGIAIDTVTGIPYTGQILVGWQDTLYEFDASTTHNPDAANYTQSYYNIFSEYGMSSQYINGYGADGVIRTQYDLQGQGLRNGETPASVYSLFGNWGTPGTTGANKEKNQQQTFKFSASADVGDHEISFGFEREERVDSYWGVGANGLWGLARQLTNKHIVDRDLGDPMPVYDINGVYQDTVNFNRLYVEAEQSTFDESLRGSLFGETNINNVEWIDLDNISPDALNINYFSANELLNGGSNYVYYFGFDAFGNPITSNTTLEDYFGRRNADGDLVNNKNELISENELSRNYEAFNPIYTAGYIQDKFAINELLFNVGIRIDNYDANQPVLKDKYLLYNPVLANNTEALSLAGGSHPTAIGDDYVVYVDDIALPTRVVGYRNENVWYNENGIQISDPTLLAEAAGGSISPLLEKKSDAVKGYKTDDAFTDYNPETIIMPRIAFSFPISDEAQFFAHYDVLAQRPPSANRIEPLDYLYMEDNVGSLLNNPDLKSEKTIDYELGFAKKLSLSSALTLSLFYKELRDMLQVTNVLGAYPATYMMYQNIDFGTVKGFSTSYDLRRTGRVQMTTNYTLQFADGTGSSASSGESLANTGQPNLRTTIPLAFDQRHALSTSVDYRYRSGDKYTGPVLFGKKILEDAGMNVMMSAGSGTPYSRQSNITQEAADGINDRSILAGSLNGSRLPW